MAVPSTGTLTMLGIAQERLYNTYGSGTISNPILMTDLINGGGLNNFPALNTSSPSKPNTSTPHAMNEWYGYDQDAAASDFFALINSGTSSSGASCASEGPDNLTLYHGTGGAYACPTVTTTVYSDAAKTNPFNGGSNWWHSPTCGAAYNISPTGIVESVVSCVESGNISEEGSPESEEGCGLEVINLVYKSGPSATPSVGETLWSDSQLTNPYQPGPGFNLWYTYQIAGTTTKYALFLVQSGPDTYIEGVNSCA